MSKNQFDRGNIMKRIVLKNVLLLVIALLFSACADKGCSDGFDVDDNHSDIYQWAVDLVSIPGNEPGNQLRAFLWIPPDCEVVNGVVLACHNLMEQGILDDADFRQGLADIGFSIVWVTPGWSTIFDVQKGAQTGFEEAMEKLADVSGYGELRYAPIVYMGHSAHASAPYHFGAWNPERTMAMLSIHGDSPLSDFLCCNHVNPDWGDTRNIDGIPGLICIGEHEWMEERMRSAFPFMKKYPESCISLLCDAGHWHSDLSEDNIAYFLTFIQKAYEYRMPKGWDGKSAVQLTKINPKDGWLADQWRPEQEPTAKAAPYSAYKGNRDSAFWYFDKEMAHLTEHFYSRERGKKYQYINIRKNGEWVNPESEIIMDYTPEADGVILHLKLEFTDSTGTKLSDEHANNPIQFKRVGGPLQYVNDTTFLLQFYRMGTAGRKTGDSDWVAYVQSDDVYRRAWRRVSFKLPRVLTDGKPQAITFPDLPDIKAGTKSITLNATSTSGLPVYYYIKGGPAVIDGDRIVFSKIPPKARYPMKVTVVAWQYGTMESPFYQTAEPVEQVFFIKECDTAFDQLEQKITSWVDRGYYNGAAVRIVKNGTPILESYFGGYTDTTALHVASAGKWVAAATIAAIVDDGFLSWDDNVSKYIPEIKDIKRDATLRQLLSHTAGYPDYQPEGRQRDDYQTLEEAVAHIVDLPADTLPGTKFRYGGLAMQMAGRMAELATGKDWETLFQEKMARPLGMKYSYFIPVSEEQGFNPMLGGGFKTCLHDYMNFLKMFVEYGHFDGKQVLSPEAVDEIVADQIKDALVSQPEYVEKARQNYHNSIYGLGVWREELDENGKATLISSPGWAGAYPWIDRRNNLYGFIIAKVNGKASAEGFSSFYGSAELPVMVRDAINTKNK